MAEQNADNRPGISIHINKQHYFAPKARMTGAEIKALAAIPAGNMLYRDERGPGPDTAIPDGQLVELHPGDHFYDLPIGVVGTEGNGTVPLSSSAEVHAKVSRELAEQIQEIIDDYSGTVVSLMPGGYVQLVIPDIHTGPNWHPAVTSVLILVPPGYPQVAPQGFDALVSPAPGCRSTNGVSSVTRNGEQWTHFCWQVQNWDPSRHRLWHYVKHVKRRFWEVA